MTTQRWNYIKSLQPPAPRMFWQSTGSMTALGKGTYDVGRNAAKRAARAARSARK